MTGKEKQLVEMKHAMIRRVPALQKQAPRNFECERMVHVAAGLMANSPNIASCTVPSVLRCLKLCTLTGLMPDGIHAHIVPFSGEATIIFGYRGLMELAFRHSEVAAILPPQVIYSHDEFDQMLGSKPMLMHKPMPLGEKRGEPIGFYAVAVLASGERAFKVIDNVEVMTLKAKMLAGKRKPGQSPWNTHYEAMGMKTAMRALCKWLPQSHDLARAIIADEFNEENISQARAMDDVFVEGIDDASGEEVTKREPTLDNLVEDPIDVPVDEKPKPKPKAKTKAKPAPKPKPEPEPEPEPAPDVDGQIPMWMIEEDGDDASDPESGEQQESGGDSKPEETQRDCDRDPEKHKVLVDKCVAMAKKLTNTPRSAILNKYKLGLIGNIKTIPDFATLIAVGKDLKAAVDALSPQ